MFEVITAQQKKHKKKQSSIKTIEWNVYILLWKQSLKIKTMTKKNTNAKQ